MSLGAEIVAPARAARGRDNRPAGAWSGQCPGSLATLTRHQAGVQNRRRSGHAAVV